MLVPFRFDPDPVGHEIARYAMLVQGGASLAERVEVAARIYELTREAHGEHSPIHALWVGILATLYTEAGEAEKALTHAERAVLLCKDSFPAGDPQIAKALNNLAYVLRRLKRQDEAEQYYRQALEIDRAYYGEEHEETLTDKRNLALCKLARRISTPDEVARARTLLGQVQGVHTRTLPATHFLIAEDLLDRAGILGKDQDWVGAACAIRQAVRIFEKSKSVSRLKTAHALGYLAFVLGNCGNVREPIRIYRRVLRMDKRELGAHHPDVGLDLYNLAIACTRSEEMAHRKGRRFPFLLRFFRQWASRRDCSEILHLMRRAWSIDDRVMSELFAIGSENQRLHHSASFQSALGVTLSFVTRYIPPSIDVICDIFNLVVRRKCIVVDASATQRDAMLSDKFPALREQLAQLTDIRRRLARNTLSGPGEGNVSEHWKQVELWTHQKEKLESDLARQIPELRLQRYFLDANRRAIAAALPTGVSLVEFIRYPTFDFGPSAVERSSRLRGSRYLAFVLGAGQECEPKMIDLGKAEPIDLLVREFLEGIVRDGGRRLGRNMVRKRKYELPVTRFTGDRLRCAVFDKLRLALGGKRRLLLGPDGNLARLPFGILPAGEGRLLMDEYQISYVNTGRDVLRFGAPVTGQPTEPVVAAGPNFGLRANGSGTMPSGGDTAGRRSQDLDKAWLCFKPLEGAEKEGKEIAQMLGVTPLLGKEVLESRLKAIQSPRILHIATHGFFLGDQERDPNVTDRWVGRDELGRFAGLTLENPLLRSGLALAGAQTWLERGPLPPEAEDGLLTAEDVTGMDLLATELAVLSACETGLGEVRTGEGVFGLQRAFILAGAKTLVMSLWKVPDDATRELMVNFYERIMNGEPRADALLAAQNDLRRTYEEPYFWGAFVCLGNPGPLPRSPEMTGC